MTAWLHAFAERCALLGLEPLPLLVLAVDVVLLLALAGGVVERCERRGDAGRWGGARTLLASGLVLLATVVLSATLLGAARRLDAPSLMASHLLALGVFGIVELSRGRRAGARELARWAWRPLAELVAPLRGLLRADAWRRARVAESALHVALLAVLAFYLVLALFTLPLNFDSNTYRLSRLALWLQNGSLDHLPADDARLNFVGQNTELVMLWLVSFFRREYPLVALVQTAGGVLACLAVYELGAQLGWARVWRLAAVATLLGIPNAATQFFSSQTDLFAAGCLAAGLAFLRPALRTGRFADAALLGAGAGLALGAKGTVLYWAPGLAVLALGWAWLERCPPRRAARGLAIAGAAALPLCGFNFVLNYLDFDHPLATPSAIRTVHSEVTAPAGKLAANAAAMLWQLFDPGSNPLVPRAVREPAAAAALDLATALSPLPGEIRRGARWLERGLSEDYASFGLVVAGFAAWGGASSLLRWRRARGGSAPFAFVLALSVVAFLVLFLALQAMTVHQFRYFCLIAPALALLCVDGLVGLRGGAGRGLAVAFVAGQLVCAAHSGVASVHSGLRALRDPGAAPWYRLREEARAALRRLGDAPQRVGMALPKESWLAPYLRSGVGHRFELLTGAQVADVESLGDLLSGRGLDALILDPALARRTSSRGVWIQPAPSPTIQRSRRLVVRPLRPGDAVRPAVLEAMGFTFGGWSRNGAWLAIANWWPRQFALRLENPTPLRREVELRSAREVLRFELAPGASIEPAIAVHERDRVTLAVTPPFVPAAHGGGATDARELGLLVAPSAILAEQGLHLDGWTEPQASFRLVNWLSGWLELDLSNPSPLRRRVVARSRCGEAALELEPGATASLGLPVLPLDSVSLAVSPEFVPAEWSAPSSDRRALGLLLSTDDLRPPAAGAFR